MRIRNIGEREAWAAAALRAIGHIDRQEAVEVIGHPCRQRCGRGTGGYLEEAAPVEMVQTAEQRLAVRQSVVAERPVFGSQLLLLAERRLVLCGESLVRESEQKGHYIVDLVL